MDTKELIKILEASPSVLIRYAAERLKEQDSAISILSNELVQLKKATGAVDHE